MKQFSVHFYAFFIFAFSLQTFADIDKIESSISMPWISPSQLSKLKADQKDVVIESAQSLSISSGALKLSQGSCPGDQYQCPNYFGQKVCILKTASSQQCRKQSADYRIVAKEIRQNPNDWNLLGKQIAETCKEGQIRNDCYRNFQQVTDAQRIVGLQKEKNRPVPIENKISINQQSPNTPSARSKMLIPESSHSKPQAKNCRTNLLIEGLRCQSTDKNVSALSLPLTYAIFCQKQIQNQKWQDEFKNQFSYFEKCLEYSTKNSKGYEKAWAKDAYYRIQKDLIPNFNSCQQEFNEGKSFATSLKGQIEIQDSIAKIKIGNENIVTQKSYIGATLESRKSNLCDFELQEQNVTSSQSTPSVQTIQAQ